VVSSLQIEPDRAGFFYSDHGMCPRLLAESRYLYRGMILTVAARARLPIIGFKYGLPRYFVW
jgi:hypothetical protein